MMSISYDGICEIKQIKKRKKYENCNRKGTDHSLFLSYNPSMISETDTYEGSKGLKMFLKCNMARKLKLLKNPKYKCNMWNCMKLKQKKCALWI